MPRAKGSKPKSSQPRVRRDVDVEVSFPGTGQYGQAGRYHAKLDGQKVRIVAPCGAKVAVNLPDLRKAVELLNEKVQVVSVDAKTGKSK